MTRYRPIGYPMRTQPRPAVCRHCGREFGAETRNQKHCSRKCAVQASRQREKRK